ncbi:MAG: hypothetical protein Q9218_004478 [Villophora microphyllina]
MDNDELLENYMPIYYAKGLENIDEANEAAEELIREYTYLTDRPSQDKQILQMGSRMELYSDAENPRIADDVIDIDLDLTSDPPRNEGDEEMADSISES